MTSLSRQTKWLLSSLHVSLKKRYLRYRIFQLTSENPVFKAEKLLTQTLIFVVFLIFLLPQLALVVATDGTAPFVLMSMQFFFIFFYNDNIENFNLNS
jgi:hypothetical protein